MGDVTGDGVDDIITGAGEGGAPRVRIFDGFSGVEVEGFFADDSILRNGVEPAWIRSASSGPSLVTVAGAGLRLFELDQINGQSEPTPQSEFGTPVWAGDGMALSGYSEDLPPTVWVESLIPSVPEVWPGSASFVIGRIEMPEMEELTVTFTLGGSASPGEYISSAIDSVIIPAGEDSVEVTITPVDDTEEESDRQVTLTLSPPAGGEYLIDPERSEAFVTIIDDDDPVNSAPVAVDDSYTVVHDRILEVPAPGVLANDFGADGDDLEVILTAEPSNGSINYQSGEISFYQGTGYFQYSPELSFVGTDSFSYRVWDGTTLSEEATVTISVTNHAPVGAADSFTIGEDQVLSVTEPPGFGSNLLTNDTDADDDVVWAELVTGTANGSLVLNQDGTFDYTPEPNFTGTDKFTCSVTDGIVSTLPVEVTITVEPGGPFDIDGWDLTTETTWMSQTEEVNYGLHADMQGASKILLRAYNLPDDWVIDSRRVEWDPSTLSVDGVAQPGYIELDPSGSGEVFPVAAVRQGYGETQITYQISGSRKVGPFEQLFTSLLQMRVVEQKAVLVSVDFTSVHQMYSDTGDVKRPGPAYNPNIPEYIQRAGRYPRQHSGRSILGQQDQPGPDLAGGRRPERNPV